jgi:tetraspanin-13/31
MVCGGFTCSKNALAALNVLYILVSFILIGVATYGKAVAIITSLAIMGGIIACGVFLLLISIVGLIGAIKHHQVLLFFYMLILFILFLIQFAVACACLAINSDQQHTLAKQGWQRAQAKVKQKVQSFFNCCGFEDTSLTDDDPLGHPACDSLQCCHDSLAGCCHDSNSTTNVPCPCTVTCWTVINRYMDQSLKIAGGIGLFFSFTEIIGVWLAVRYRNQKDPRANPSAFL